MATALVIFGIRELSHTLVHPHIPDHPGYAVEVAGSTGADAGPVEVVKVISLAELLASASVSSGERVAKKCAACHTFDKGGANKTGPNLWNLVGRAAAGVDGFGFSSAMSSSGLTWDFETLNKYLTKPKELVPGTAMSFAGIKKDKDRANLLAWIRSQSDAPLDLPAFTAPVEEIVEAAAEMAGDAAEDIQTAAIAGSEVIGDAAEAGADDLLDSLPNVSGVDPTHEAAVEQAGAEALDEITGGDQ
ncbi:MAG: cytochrome c family protein [Robiginitomaculum sp.]|nr:MAG: cytochrome c family protein [Robiginitomaculum sp.]